MFNNDKKTRKATVPSEKILEFVKSHADRVWVLDTETMSVVEKREPAEEKKQEPKKEQKKEKPKAAEPKGPQTKFAEDWLFTVKPAQTTMFATAFASAKCG